MRLVKTIMATAAFCFAAFVHAEININTATMKQLAELDNIGAVKAAAIVEYRTENGHFQTVDELLKVKGIGLAILEANRDMLTVGLSQDKTAPMEKAMPSSEMPSEEMSSEEMSVEKQVTRQMSVPNTDKEN